MWETADFSGDGISLSSGTTYYIGILKTSGTWRWKKATTDRTDMPTGDSLKTSSGWTLGGPETAGDYYFRINECN